MKHLLLILSFLACAGAFAEQSTGERVKSDAKAMGRQVKDAAVDVGHQVRDGSKKAYRSVKGKVKSDARDVKAGKPPGDGRHAAREQARARKQEGRK